MAGGRAVGRRGPGPAAPRTAPGRCRSSRGGRVRGDIHAAGPRQCVLGRRVRQLSREQVAEAIGGADGLVEVLRDGAERGFDHLGIARVLYREGRGEEALEWIGRGLEGSEADIHDGNLRALAARIHRESGRMETAEQMLWRNFEERPGTTAYRELSNGTGEHFPRWRDRAIAVLK